ncbi:MAG TPA: right-handed parallel beta-helix repeat-containing protein [Planctomycetota bacterium]|jgi:hypothetical protein
MRIYTIAFLILFAASATIHAREITVEPDPNGRPVLAKAIESAAAGDSLLIKKGVYRETLVITKTLKLSGEAGAVIDPSEAFAPQWTAETAIGKGVYGAKVPDRSRALMLDGKILAEIDSRRANEEGEWFWKTLLATGTPKSKFTYVRALWMYHAPEKKIYLHLADDASPEKLTWTILWSKEPVISIRGAAEVSVTGLTLAHGYTGVELREKASRCTISNSTIGPWEKHGVLIGGEASECLIEKNEIFRGAYEDWKPLEPKERYEVWQIHKKVGYYDRVGIDLVRAGVGNRIHANHVFETFDGINIGDSGVESLDVPLANPDHGKGTEIWDNVIENTRDSGMELGVGCIDVKVHHNILRQTHGGLRFKLPRIGPVYIYRNLLVDGSPFNIWYSMDDSPAEGYVYHNTIVGGSAAMIYSSFSKGGHQIGAPKWHYYNNLCVTKGFFANHKVNAPLNFTADYNLVVGGGKPWPEDRAKDQHSLYVEEIALSKEYHPLPGSPAIDAGLDLSTIRDGKPLPGCEGHYFKGKAPDIGAYEE